jgi:3-oxoacyl-[acyl-carrier protein] reductase
VTINSLLPGAFDTDCLKVTMAGAAKKTGQTVEVLADVRRKIIPAKSAGRWRFLLGYFLNVS